MFHEMRVAVRARRAHNETQAKASSSAGGADKEGQVLVGFGLYSQMTMASLFNSSKLEHSSYVKHIVNPPVMHPGGKLDKLQRYIRKKQEEKADDETLVQLVTEIEQRTTGTGNTIIKKSLSSKINIIQ